MGRVARLTTSSLVSAAAVSAAAAVAVTVHGPAGWLQFLLAGTAVVFWPVTLVGIAILQANQRSPVGWILAVAGAALPLSMALQTAAYAGFHGWSQLPSPAALNLGGDAAAVFGVPLVATIGVLLFPDGLRGSARRRRWVIGCSALLVTLLVWVLFSPKLTDYPKRDNPIGAGGVVGGVIGAGVLTILLLAPVTFATATALRRRARAGIGELRPALRLAAQAAYIMFGSFATCVIVGVTTGASGPITAVENCAALTLGVVSWIAIIRFGLFDRRAVLSRGLLYGTLTLVVAAVYLLTVLAFDSLVRGRGPQVLATAVAVLVALPLREVAQRAVNTLVYGLRDRPAAALARLGEQLEAAGAPDELLPAAVRTIAEASRLPYVAVEAGGELLAVHGRPGSGAVLRLELPFAHESVGSLVVESRDRIDSFSRADRVFLETLARQLAVTVQAVTLSRSLQVSRERLVNAREEERRRLRRDLHDGLGPTLAGIALGIDTVRRSLPAEGANRELLASLRGEAERAVGDVRRIAYDLRPPVLDDLGLVGAVNEQARLSGATVVVPEPLPKLPAAVEVAAYRITLEAMTNAFRHAAGSQVTVTLSCNGRLVVEVADDGSGLPQSFRAGVGIASMLERAAEIGGACTVSPGRPRGTIVRATLPLEHQELGS